MGLSQEQSESQTKHVKQQFSNVCSFYQSWVEELANHSQERLENMCALYLVVSRVWFLHCAVLPCAYFQKSFQACLKATVPS